MRLAECVKLNAGEKGHPLTLTAHFSIALTAGWYFQHVSVAVNQLWFA